eukprot:jgi/Psemu1/54180/gm1.54180_g
MSKGIPSSLSEGRKFPPIAVPLSDSGSINRSIGGQAPRNTVSKRIRKRNPFSEGRRKNFPNLDDVFRTTTNIVPSGIVRGENDSFHYHRNSLDETDDDLSDIGGSSVLNMSIGARAALNEHARYVEKYGIDGEMNKASRDDNNNNSNSSSNEIYSTGDTNLMLDYEWEKLLDISQINSSIGRSDSGVIPSPSNFSTTNSNFDVINTSSERSTRYEESSSIEVMTDVSHDYFNSSRVNLLVTPERNRNLGMRMIMTRDGEGVDNDRCGNQQGLPFGGLESNTTSYNDENDKSEDYYIRSSIGIQGRLFGSDSRGTSFNLGDLSRISNNTLSDTNRMPNTSFQDFHPSREENDARQNTNDSFTTNAGKEPPSMILNNSSFSSCLGLRGTSQLSFDNNDRKSPRNLFSPSVEKKSRGQAKANLSPDGSMRSSSSIQSTVSNFLAEARSMAKRVVSDVEKSIGAVESLQADFLRSLEIGRTDAPSPISQIFSTPSSSRQDSTNKEQRQRRIDKSPNDDGRSSIYTNESNSNNISSLSSSVSVQEGTSHLYLTGRKRYRTVVPRRVYLDSPSQPFPEEQDSFVAVQSNPETTSAGRCLLESFEEAATSNTF